MKRAYLFLMFSFVLVQSVIILPQTISKIQTVEKNVCPFEGCQFGKWIIKDTIKVYKKEGDTSSVKFNLNYNDTISAITGNVHYEKFGEVLVTKSFDDFKVNDTVIVLRCIEGEFICYYKGKEILTNIFWPINNGETENPEGVIDNEKSFGKIIEEPQLTWWVKISKKEDEGWIRLINQNPYCFQIKEKIEGMDLLE